MHEEPKTAVAVVKARSALLALLLALMSLVIAPQAKADGEGWHDGWCLQGEGIAIVVDWTASPEVWPEAANEDGTPGDGILIRCITDLSKVDLTGADVGSYVTAAGIAWTGQPNYVDNIEGVFNQGYLRGTGTIDEGWNTSNYTFQGLRVDAFVFFINVPSGSEPHVVPQFASPGVGGGGTNPGGAQPELGAPEQTYQPQPGGGAGGELPAPGQQPGGGGELQAPNNPERPAATSTVVGPGQTVPGATTTVTASPTGTSTSPGALEDPEQSMTPSPTESTSGSPSPTPSTATPSSRPSIFGGEEPAKEVEPGNPVERPIWPWIVGGIALVGFVGGAVAFNRLRRPSGEEE